MYFLKRIVFFLPLIIFISCSTQNKNLLVAEFGDNKIYMDEFEKAYAQASGGMEKAKNDSLPALKNFLDLYVNYKMKLRDAVVRGFNNDPDLEKEYNDYKRSISKTVFIQDRIYEPGLKQMHERRNLEYRVSHIFLTPDSLHDAKQTEELAKELIQRIQKGEDFAELAKKYSKDSYTAGEGGDVYYVTSGQINIPAIEDALYSTEVGKVFPEPVSSGYGLHILKVTGINPRKNAIRAQHILVTFTDSTGTDSTKALKTITEVEEKLKNGFDFGELAKKYSADRGSAARSGDLGYFSRGQMVKEFDEAAFKLKVGEISPIVKTRFGYHIIKLADIKPLPSYEEEKNTLKEIYDRVRYQYDYDKLVKNLKTELNFTPNPSTVNKILALNDTMKVGKEYSKSKIKSEAGNDPMFTLNSKVFTCDSLFNHLIKAGLYQDMKVDAALLQNATDEYSSSLAVDEKAWIYDKVNPELAKLLSEYRNGTYLFKLLEDEVWSKISVDSAKIFAFWEATKANYNWKDRVEFKEIYNSNEAAINNCYASAVSNIPFDTLFVKYNQRRDYVSKSGLKGMVDTDVNELAKQANQLIKPGDFSKPFKFEDGWSIVKLVKKEAARQKTLEEAKNEAAGALQEKENKRLEDIYLDKLKKIYEPKYYYEELSKAFKSAN